MNTRQRKTPKGPLPNVIPKVDASCRFLQDALEQPLPLEVMREKIYCIPDRKGRALYYLYDASTKQLQFFGYQNMMNKCLSQTPVVRQHISEQCLDRSVLARFSDDSGRIKQFLRYFEEKGTIEPCILDFLEQLTLFTQMTYADFLQIMGGGYVVLKNDGGRVYRMFKKCEQSKFSWNLPVGVDWSTWSLKTKDVVPMSSHDKYMTGAYRIGAGHLALCDKDGLYSTDEPIKNPRFDILLGLSIDPNFPGDTAFQFESCRMDDLTNFVRHGLVYFEYRWVRKNVGAFGYSIYTDKTPLVIETCGGNFCPRFLRR